VGARGIDFKGEPIPRAPKVIARRALLGDHGTPSGLLTRFLILLSGAAVVVMSALDLREAARFSPQQLTCAQWLAAPNDARWVSLTGCHLDLELASSRLWKGLWFSPSPDGGSRARLLELFVPLSSTDAHELPVRAVVATSDPALLALLDEVLRLDVSQVAGFLDQHRAELQASVQPAVLTGYVEPVASLASRSALTTIGAPGAAVLQQGREPPRANGLFGVLLGLGLMTGASYRVLQRWRRLRRGEELDEEEDD
jgi:hypothetical protein